MHPKLFRSFALVAMMICQNFEKITPLELANSVGVRDPRAVHLGDETMQFAFQVVAPHPVLPPGQAKRLIVPLSALLDPVGWHVLDGVRTAEDLGLKV